MNNGVSHWSQSGTLSDSKCTVYPVYFLTVPILTSLHQVAVPLALVKRALSVGRYNML